MSPLRSRNRERSERHNHDIWRQLYQLQSTSLFDFMARNQATMSSDVDVWVELNPLIPYATVHLKHELELLRVVAQDDSE